MPTVYLSPSAQEFNSYVTGGSEEYYANLIVDAMIPYLDLSGIDYVRNNRSDNVTQIIDESNEIGPDLHLAIHSNAAPEQLSGVLRGPQVLYYPRSASGRRGAEIFASNLRAIYPNPSRVRVIPTAELSELERTNAPSVYVELGYHDNQFDAEWITQNIDLIARNLSLSVAEFFNLPLITDPNEQGEDTEFPRLAVVNLSSGRLNIRREPNASSEVVGRAGNGAFLEAIGRSQDGNWYRVRLDNGVEGFAKAEFLLLD